MESAKTAETWSTTWPSYAPSKNIYRGSKAAYETVTYNPTQSKIKKTWRAWRGGTVVKVLALHAWHPIWAPVLSRQPRFPSSSLPVALRTAQSFGTLHPCRRPRKGSWLRIGIASAVALTWGVNHRTEDLPLCFSSLYIRLSNKKIIEINL